MANPARADHAEFGRIVPEKVGGVPRLGDSAHAMFRGDGPAGGAVCDVRDRERDRSGSRSGALPNARSGRRCSKPICHRMVVPGALPVDCRRRPRHALLWRRDDPCAPGGRPEFQTVGLITSASTLDPRYAPRQRVVRSLDLSTATGELAFPAAMRGKRQPPLLPEGVLDPANCVLDLAFDLFGLAFSLDLRSRRRPCRRLP